MKEKIKVQARSSIKSLVVNTSICDCSLKCGSLDQTGKNNLKTRAKYATSFSSEINLDDFKKELDNRFNVKSVCIYNPFNIKQIKKKSKLKVKFDFFSKDI